MRLGHGHVKFRRSLAGIAGRVFDDETFLAGIRVRADCPWVSPRADRQIFQTEITPDAVLQMHDEIAFLQIREINVQRRTRGLGVRRFEPARALDFVAAKNLRIGDDHEFGFVAKKTASESA